MLNQTLKSTQNFSHQNLKAFMIQVCYTSGEPQKSFQLITKIFRENNYFVNDSFKQIYKISSFMKKSSSTSTKSTDPQISIIFLLKNKRDQHCSADLLGHR